MGSNDNNPPVKWWRDGGKIYAKLACLECGAVPQRCLRVQVTAWAFPPRKTFLDLQCPECQQKWSYDWNMLADPDELPEGQR